MSPIFFCLSDKRPGISCLDFTALYPLKVATRIMYLSMIWWSPATSPSLVQQRFPLKLQWLGLHLQSSQIIPSIWEWQNFSLESVLLRKSRSWDCICSSELWCDCDSVVPMDRALLHGFWRRKNLLKIPSESCTVCAMLNLISHKGETADVCISSCQAKQLQVNCTLYFWSLIEPVITILPCSANLCSSVIPGAEWDPPFLLSLLNFPSHLPDTFLSGKVKPGDSEWPGSYVAGNTEPITHVLTQFTDACSGFPFAMQPVLPHAVLGCLEKDSYDSSCPIVHGYSNASLRWITRWNNTNKKKKIPLKYR